MASGARRISVGFQGGQVLALRVSDEQLKALYKALGDGGWHELETEDGPVGCTSGRSSTSARRVRISASASVPSGVCRSLDEQLLSDRARTRGHGPRPSARWSASPSSVSAARCGSRSARPGTRSTSPGDRNGAGPWARSWGPTR